MKIKAANPETGKSFSGEAPKLNEITIKEYFNITNKTKAEVRRLIDNQDLSAEAKNILYNIAKTTLQAGSLVVNIGLKILDVAITLLSEYRHTTFLSILGLIFGLIVSTIPVIGILFGPLFGLLIGGVFGVMEDIKDRNMKRRIQEVCIEFQKFQTN